MVLPLDDHTEIKYTGYKKGIGNRMSESQFIDQLVDVVGPDNVLTEPADLEAYLNRSKKKTRAKRTK